MTLAKWVINTALFENLCESMCVVKPWLNACADADFLKVLSNNISGLFKYFQSGFRVLVTLSLKDSLSEGRPVAIKSGANAVKSECFSFRTLYISGYVQDLNLKSR